MLNDYIGQQSFQVSWLSLFHYQKIYKLIVTLMDIKTILDERNEDLLSLFPFEIDVLF